MAITVITEPNGYRPAYNESVWIVNSNQRMQPNFSYIADVLINNVKVDRLKVPPHPTFGRGVFDVSETVRDYIVSNFDLDLTAITPSSGSVVIVDIQFGEEYGLSSTGTVVYPNLNQSTVRAFWNGVIDPMDEIDGVAGLDFRAEDSTKRFLTNRKNIRVYKNEKDFLYINQRIDDEVYYAKVTVQNEGNPFDEVFYVRNYYSFINPLYTGANLRQVRVPSGFNLNDIPSGHVTPSIGSLPIIKSTTTSYQIQMVDVGFVAKSESMNFTVSDFCGKYSPQRMYFKNRLGGYDAFTFTKRKIESTSIVRERYKKNRGYLSDLTTWNNSLDNREMTDYVINLEDNIILNSDLLTSGDVVWIQDMVESTDVRMEIKDRAIPVSIENATYSRKGDDKIYSLRLEVKPTYKRYRQ
jgi:hypothetical protein